MSLGEDGHLAGHFHNSSAANDSRFCYTDDSPKPPKKRISFNVNWLYGSSKIILAVIGENKLQAFEDLMMGVGLHSDIIDLNNLILITDLDISKNYKE